jgi:small subunit ribosomal protein S9
MADEQPPVEGEEPGSSAPEGGAEQAAPDAASEQAAPDAASEQAAPAAAQQDESGEGGEESAAPEAAQEPAPAAAEETAADAPAEDAAPAAAEASADGTPADEKPAAGDPAAAEASAAETPADEKPAAGDPAADEAPADERPAAGEDPGASRQVRAQREDEPQDEPVVPGAHLEPDLVLEESRPAEGEYDPYATDEDGVPAADGEQAASVEETPVARTPLELAADARYRATGKRKRAIARVILKPGSGTYTINGKELDTYFPRVTLQRNCRLPLQTTGNDSRMDVVAKIHGGGVSSQAIALRHGISRALVEADPNLRTELKRQGFLTRDARVKERKKAGLKKARKRPQFSKR